MGLFPLLYQSPARAGLFYCPHDSKDLPRMSKVRLCAQILPTGSQCKQFALRSRPWCQVHADSRQRERAAHAGEVVAKFPSMDLFGAAVTLLETTFEVQHKHLSPLHAYAIYEAAATRLDQLAEEAYIAREQARIAAEQAARRQPAASVKPNQSNRLHPSPIK